MEDNNNKSNILKMQLEANVRAAGLRRGDVTGQRLISANQCVTSAAALFASSRNRQSGLDLADSSITNTSALVPVAPQVFKLFRFETPSSVALPSEMLFTSLNEDICMSQKLTGEESLC